ncbi:hypothetical protein [Caudoviricetes sp.]|nr:hypothetical protein [Caudoviricetes sp.]
MSGQNILQLPSGGNLTIAAADSASNNVATFPANTGTVITTGSSGKVIPAAALPAGCILQVVSATKTDTYGFAGAGTFSSIPGLSVTITPTSSTSKFLIISNIMLGVAAGSASAILQYVRNSTVIDIGNAAGSRPQVSAGYYSGDTAGTASFASISATYLDSPATGSTITYSIQGASSTSTTVYVNRTVDDRNFTGYDPRGTSTITVMEIAA